MMNEQQLKDLVVEFAKGIKTEDDLNQFTRLLTKLTVETALNAELTEHLGHEKNARKSGSNTRNGYSSKRKIFYSLKRTKKIHNWHKKCLLLMRKFTDVLL